MVQLEKALSSIPPIHQQVCERLIRDIASGQWLDGQKLPPEREHAAHLGVAVGTLRKALAELSKRGLVERIQGSGNYIRVAGIPEALLSTVYSLFRLELQTGGGVPTADVLSVDKQQKPGEMKAFGESAYAHRIRRLRSLDGQAAALEEIWLEASFVDHVVQAELDESLYLYYRDVLDVHVVRAQDRVGIATIPNWVPGNFTLDKGEVCGFVERYSWSHDSRPVEYSKTWFDPSIARYIANLG